MICDRLSVACGVASGFLMIVSTLLVLAEIFVRTALSKTLYITEEYSGYMMAAQTMILEFGSRAEMPMRIAISSTAEGIMASLGPLVGGFVADHYGFDVVFGASIGFLVVGLIILLTVVKEPRKARLAAAMPDQ